MGKAILLVVGVVLFVYAVFDLVATPAAQARTLPKALWFVVLLVPVAGPVLWLSWGHLKAAGPPRSSGPTPPPRPRGPDDDPDYLRGL